MIYRYSDIQALVRANRINEIKTVVKGSDVVRHDSLSRRKDSYIYIFLDPRDMIKDYQLTEDCTLKHVIVYIGRGTGSRVSDHDITTSKRKTVSNLSLSEWIIALRSQGVEPLVMIYAKNLSKTQTELIEADLQLRNELLQNPYRGLPEYRNVRTPISNFNKRVERSYTGDCYSINGDRIQRRRNTS